MYESTSYVLQSFIDAMRNPLLIVDEGIHILTANKAFHAAFKGEGPGVMGKCLYELENGAWNTCELRSRLDESVTEFQPLIDFKIDRRMARGAGAIFLLNMTELTCEAHEVRRLLITLEDITDKERIQERLNLSIVESNHRIKNSFNVIVNHLSLLARRGKTLAPDDLKNLISNIRNYAALHDVLSIQASQATPGQQTIHMKPLFEKLLCAIRASAADRSIEWNVTDVELSPANASSMGLVLNELVANALKHSNGKVNICFHKLDNWIILEVSDDGDGYPEGFQIDLSKPCGLSLLAKLVESDLEGKLEFENLPTGGSRTSVIMSAKEEKYFYVDDMKELN